MKKTKIVLKKRLSLGKNEIMSLSGIERMQVRGGADTGLGCGSNGCSLVDTLCKVHMPTFPIPANCVVKPVDSLFPCNPEVSVNVCKVKNPGSV
ncbi:hypothetical protein [Taibaiella koreensis]|uniref:hypothetical protein n=1 Tax=Taibaiella koreensis TaxID=1268548 RepID=UPI000E59E8FB|nr:hypothetical protein [Taibaiella koreensis]